MVSWILASLSIASAPLIGEHLAVVGPAAWEEPLGPFLEARRADLERVSFVPLEDLAGEPGQDAAERLKRRLFALWRGEGLSHVLLVGDADTLPVRFMVLDRVTPEAFDTAFYASDLYYADLADEHGELADWNAAREGHQARYFGQVRGEKHKEGVINHDGVSYVPEVALGRWPVSSLAELQSVVAKTLAFAPREGARRALLVHADGWVDSRQRLGRRGDELGAAGWSVARQLFGEGVPHPASVRDALLAGVELAVHVGHGTHESWHDCLGPSEREALAAAPGTVYVSVGCSTAHFCAEAPYAPYLDEDGVQHRGTLAGEVFTSPPPPPACLQPGRYDSTGLGERLLCMESGGAVVYVGCNTGAQPCALTLLDGFLMALACDPGARAGDAWRAALGHYVEAEGLFALEPNESWYPPSVFFQGMKFMLFGDPTLRLTLAPG